MYSGCGGRINSFPPRPAPYAAGRVIARGILWPRYRASLGRKLFDGQALGPRRGIDPGFFRQRRTRQTGISEFVGKLV
jgi:hypothetical protein